MNYYIIYDIADPKRLRRIAGILKDFGVRRQKSKFEADLSSGQLRRLQAEIARVIEPQRDGVKYIPLCERCSGKTEVYGQGENGIDHDRFEIV